ncbi:MAG: hypothetical protein U0457_13915 [Candidatus Sericytochromatia bacterium]
MVFYVDENKDKKITYPKKIMYNSLKDPIESLIGMPMNIDLIDNKYLVYKNWYPSGGSGSMENIYLIDIKDPKIWHLACVQVIGGDYANYYKSPDNKYILFYDSFFDLDSKIASIDNEFKTSYGVPVPSETTERSSEVFSNKNKVKIHTFSNEKFSKILKEKYKKDFSLYLINQEFKGNFLELFFGNLINNTSEEEKYKIILDLHNNNIKSITSLKKLAGKYDLENLFEKNYKINFYDNDILNYDYTFSKAIYSKKIGNKTEYNAKIIRTSDLKVIFEYSILLDTNIDQVLSLNWITPNKVFFINEKKQYFIIDLSKENIQKKEINPYFINNFNENNLSPDYKYYLYLNKSNFNFSIFTNDTKKQVFKSTLFSENTYKWLDNKTLLFFDKEGYLKILKIEDKITILKLKNSPLLKKLDKKVNDIFSNYYNNKIAFLVDNQIYLLDLKNLEIKQLTNYNFPLKLDKERNTLVYSDKNPIIKNLVLDKNKLFYAFMEWEYNAKIMLMELNDF